MLVLIQLKIYDKHHEAKTLEPDKASWMRGDSLINYQDCHDLDDWESSDKLRRMLEQSPFDWFENMKELPENLRTIGTTYAITWDADNTA